MEPVSNALQQFNYLRNNEKLDYTERMIAFTGGSFFTVVGMIRGGLSGFLFSTFGGALTFSGLTGINPVYEVGKASKSQVKIRQSVLINKDRETVYQYWRNLENLPKIMDHIKKVEELDEISSRWHVEVGGIKVNWDAEIVFDEENWRISWNSYPESEIHNSGKVEFVDAGQGYTLLHVLISYKPKFGDIGLRLAKVLNPIFEQQVREDIMKWKDAMEKEVVT
jgi:uncharacterized membrane protein